MTKYPGKKIGVFASGGLVSWAVCKYLVENGAQVVALLADVGQADGDLIEDYISDMHRLHVQVVRRDLRNDLSKLALTMIRCNAHYDGGYWNSTGALRYMLVSGFQKDFEEHSFNYLSHGCVGGGNDQMRFHRYGRHFLRPARELVMWDQPDFSHRFPSRAAMVDYIGYKSLEAKIDNSTDACLIGMSYEGTGFEEPEFDITTISPKMSRWPWEASDACADIAIGFENGLATHLDGEQLSPFQLLQTLNSLAGLHGVSLRSSFENRINGTKCKGIYESPGMDVLAHAFQSLMSMSIHSADRERIEANQSLLGRLMYEGKWHKRPESDAALNKINGVVKIRVYKGNICTIAILDHHRNDKVVFQKRFAGGGHVWGDC